MIDYSQELLRLVLTEPSLVRALELVRDAGPPGAYIAAGAIREVVWNSLTGRTPQGPSGDLDVIYLDSEETSDCSAKYQALLNARAPSHDWEVVNQAFVHLWLREETKDAHAPFKSVSAALRSWPEIATAVAVRLNQNDQLEVLAPFGLDDLFGLVVRPNPHCPTQDAYSSRVSSKSWASRWPELKIEPARDAARQNVTADTA